MEQTKTIDQLYQDSPLLAFSFYTHMQAEITRRLGKDVIATLDTAITPHDADQDVAATVDATAINYAYGQFWLWVLATYEVVRTMSRASDCFSKPCEQQLREFKQHITGLRIPFAKQEYAGKSNQPIGSEASIAGINSKTRDMSFKVRGINYSARELITRFDDFIRYIRPGDILHPHGWSGKRKVT